MNKTIEMTVKNISELKDYFGRFQGLGSTVLVCMYKDRFVTRGFFESTNFFKKSTLKYSDVFEESEIDINGPIYLGLFKKIDQLITDINFFTGKEEFKLKFGCKSMADKSIHKLVSAWNEGYEDVSVVDNMTFNDKQLRVKLSSSELFMIKKAFNLTDDVIEGLISNNEVNEILGGLELDSGSLSEMLSLIKTSNKNDIFSSGVLIKSDKSGENLIISIENFFDYKLPLLECQKPFSFHITHDVLAALDREDYSVSIVKNPKVESLVFKSKNSDTLSFAAGKLENDKG